MRWGEAGFGDAAVVGVSVGPHLDQGVQQGRDVSGPVAAQYGGGVVGGQVVSRGAHVLATAL
ncbi:hypothetical protein [Streptomyces sp. STR69]|uniref:hypothetical protein n=1 Tax=Streptomyces sp. STR69 TaxID=1796942 RepID=UPI0021C800DB|nr:hypothetical protein [Streptomyces sp. STR69]